MWSLNESLFILSTVKPDEHASFLDGNDYGFVTVNFFVIVNNNLQAIIIGIKIYSVHKSVYSVPV